MVGRAAYGDIAHLALSPREVATFAAYARHGRQKDAAAELGISPWTIRSTLGRAYEKLGVEGALEALGVMGWLIVPNDLSGRYARGMTVASGQARAIDAAIDELPARRLEELRARIDRRLRACVIDGNDGAVPLRLSGKVGGKAITASILLCPACVERHRLPEGRSET